jgi:phosphatidate cytidylyltransferase
MFTKRLLVIIVLLPVFVVLGMVGGWMFTGLACIMLGIAAWEYWRMFTSGGHRPSAVVVVGGVVLLTLARQLDGFNTSSFVICILAMLAMGIHTIQYERGREQAATDLAITLGGLLYFGWLGPYIISLRNLEQGQYWLLLVLPAVWLMDVGGYLIGSWIGRLHMAPRTSPNKSWEGYIGGLIFAVLGTGALAFLWGLMVPVMTFQKGAILGLVIGVFSPLGDLGESMIKRQFGFKDSSGLLPGHGGAWDRIDSWIWAWVIGYYMVLNLLW